MEAIKHGYEENRRILIEGLPKAGLTKFLPADGAFYLYADVSDFTSDSFAFAREMLEKAHVAATPGVDFDPVHGRAFIRFSYARSAEEMHEAVAPHRALACIARRNPSPDICRYKPQLERFPCPPARCHSPSLSSIFHWPQCSGRTGPMEFPPRFVAVILVALGTALLTLSAKVNLPLPYVPMTLQTLVVLMIGAAYGWRLGCATVIAYLAEGAIGFPVFAGPIGGLAPLFGPTGGYLVGFVPAAFATGWLSERGWDRSVPRLFVAMALGHIIILAAGYAWLAVGMKLGFEKAWLVGIAPFIAASRWSRTRWAQRSCRRSGGWPIAAVKSALRRRCH